MTKRQNIEEKDFQSLEFDWDNSPMLESVVSENFFDLERRSSYKSSMARSLTGSMQGSIVSNGNFSQINS
jgi:hypothetical protein